LSGSKEEDIEMYVNTFLGSYKNLNIHRESSNNDTEVQIYVGNFPLPGSDKYVNVTFIIGQGDDSRDVTIHHAADFYISFSPAYFEKLVVCNHATLFANWTSYRNNSSLYQCIAATSSDGNLPDDASRKLLLDQSLNYFELVKNETEPASIMFNKAIQLAIHKQMIKPGLRTRGAAKKPILYLYNKNIGQTIHIQLNESNSDEKLSYVYPRNTLNEGNIWKVQSDENGSICDTVSGRQLNYLFWETSIHQDNEDSNNSIWLSENGVFVVNKSDYIVFLETALCHMGLQESEMNDFIVYWLPQMNEFEKCIIKFQVDPSDTFCSSVYCSIEPKPDIYIKVMMAFQGSNNNSSDWSSCDKQWSVTRIQQELPCCESRDRKCFVAVEWGGRQF
jgi:hypothetical protein